MTQDRLRSLPLYLVFFLSGLCALACEIVWIRTFVPVFGLGLYAVSAVTAAYLGGMALGGYLAGRSADTREYPLRYFAGIAALLGISVLAVPYLARSVAPLLPVVFNAAGADFRVYSLFRFCAAFTILLFPGSLIGAMLPVLARAHAGRGDAGRRFSSLYAVNTLGSLAGCYAAAFFLLRYLGVAASTRLACLLALALGALAYFLSPRYPAALPVPESGGRRPGRRTVLAASFLVGFCGLSYEILWSRGLTNTLGNDVYTFPVILILFLAGSSAGSWLAAARMPRLAVVLPLSVCAAVASLVSLRYPPAMELFAHWNQFFAATVGIAVLPTAFFSGMIFPAAVALYSAGGRTAGADTGAVYAWNTAGAMLGSFVTGFLLIPFLGLREAALAVLYAHVCAGMLFMLDGSRKSAAAAAGAGALLIFLAHACVPKDLFLKILYDTNEAILKRVARTEAPSRLLYYKDGVNGSMIVVRNTVQGREETFIAFSDMTGLGAETAEDGPMRRNHRLKAHIPLLLHPAPQRVLNIGFGTGITARSVTLHPGLRAVENVDILPQTFEAARFFLPDADRVLGSPNVRSVVDDGRNHLFLSRERYDVILLYPSSAETETGSAYLYTAEFLRLCRERLAPGGLVAVWFPFRGANADILLATFLDVFPGTTMWSTASRRAGDQAPFTRFLVGTASGATDVPPGCLAARFRSLAPAVRRELGQAGIVSAADFRKHFVADAAELRARAAGTALRATDDRTIVDYSSLEHKEAFFYR